jgi:hypothetical protein
MRRVYHRLPVETRFWAKVDRTGSCWEWTAYRQGSGYGWFWVRGQGPQRVSVLAHRMAWELTHGPIPDGLCVCHHCDNPPCCNPVHLFLGTDSDNKVDAWNKGRGTRPCKWGEENGYAKLTEAAIREIRRRYAAGGVTQQELADAYGVNQTKISAAILRRTWAHIA